MQIVATHMGVTYIKQWLISKYIKNLWLQKLGSWVIVFVLQLSLILIYVYNVRPTNIVKI
jgi:hypothetical protein